MIYRIVTALMLVAMTATVRAETVAKTITWDNEKWIPVGLASEGIELKEVRFAVEGGVHWNPLRAGIGPQAFVSLKNTSDHESKLAIAVALFAGVVWVTVGGGGGPVAGTTSIAAISGSSTLP